MLVKLTLGRRLSEIAEKSLRITRVDCTSKYFKQEKNIYYVMCAYFKDLLSCIPVLKLHKFIYYFDFHNDTKKFTSIKISSENWNKGVECIANTWGWQTGLFQSLRLQWKPVKLLAERSTRQHWKPRCHIMFMRTWNCSEFYNCN